MALPDRRPAAVLLDVGGVFLLPDPEVIGRALALAGVTVDLGGLDRAHYHGAAAFPSEHDEPAPFPVFWNDYLDAYCAALGVPDAQRAEAIEHLEAAFSSMAAWSAPVDGARDGLAAIVATGVAVGIVSNSDGTVAALLREREIAQVGPGPGVEVRCIIDSGEVGVEKPDPRIFRIALDALGVDADETWYVGDTPGIDVVGARRAGVHPIVIDPFGLHAGASFTTVRTLAEVADLVRARP